MARKKDLCSKEQQLEESFKVNYLAYISILVASNIYSIYKQFNNDYDVSLNSIIGTSQDTVILDSKEKELLYDLIKQALKDYKLEIVGHNYDDKLILNERKFCRRYGKETTNKKSKERS